MISNDVHLIENDLFNEYPLFGLTYCKLWSYLHLLNLLSTIKALIRHWTASHYLISLFDKLYNIEIA